MADVPVGIFLSGGIDSAALAGLMIDAGATNLQGVTVAYDEFAGSPRDEAPTAALVASHYNIKHHVRRVTGDEFERDLPRILAAMDQPSVDGINTWYASKAVAELGLKVVVSGVGGDELFQGYSHFRTLPYLVSTWSGASLLPGVKSLARSIMKRVAERRGDGRWNQAPDWAMSIEGAWCLRRGLFSLADLPFLMGPELAAAGLRGFYPNDMVAAVCGTLSTNSAMALSQIESTFYLRNQLLRDSDWASMDHSVELRTPLVDAWLIQELQPLLSEFHKFPNKMLLAMAPSRPLPQAVMRRPKTGFGIPIQKWLGRRAEESAGGHSRSWAREIGRAYTDSVGQ